MIRDCPNLRTIDYNLHNIGSGLKYTDKDEGYGEISGVSAHSLVRVEFSEDEVFEGTISLDSFEQLLKIINDKKDIQLSTARVRLYKLLNLIELTGNDAAGDYSVKALRESYTKLISKKSRSLNINPYKKELYLRALFSLYRL